MRWRVYTKSVCLKVCIFSSASATACCICYFVSTRLRGKRKKDSKVEEESTESGTAATPEAVNVDTIRDKEKHEEEACSLRTAQRVEDSSMSRAMTQT